MKTVGATKAYFASALESGKVLPRNNSAEPLLMSVTTFAAALPRDGQDMLVDRSDVDEGQRLPPAGS